MDRKDWTLIVTNAAGDSNLSPVQLQKALFLIGENLRNLVGDNFYEFIPYNYGPFSSAIYQDAEQMEVGGLVHVEHGDFNQYSITPSGQQCAIALEKNIDHEIVEYIHKLVDWVKNQSFPGLIQWIYKNYPQYSINSIYRF
jgi:uncharacterized protein YwgA